MQRPTTNNTSHTVINASGRFDLGSRTAILASMNEVLESNKKIIEELELLNQTEHSSVELDNQITGLIQLQNNLELARDVYSSGINREAEGIRLFQNTWHAAIKAGGIVMVVVVGVYALNMAAGVHSITNNIKFLGTTLPSTAKKISDAVSTASNSILQVIPQSQAAITQISNLITAINQAPVPIQSPNITSNVNATLVNFDAAILNNLNASLAQIYDIVGALSGGITGAEQIISKIFEVVSVVSTTAASLDLAYRTFFIGYIAKKVIDSVSEGIRSANPVATSESAKDRVLYDAVLNALRDTRSIAHHLKQTVDDTGLIKAQRAEKRRLQMMLCKDLYTTLALQRKENTTNIQKEFSPYRSKINPVKLAKQKLYQEPSRQVSTLHSNTQKYLKTLPVPVSEEVEGDQITDRRHGEIYQHHELRYLHIDLDVNDETSDIERTMTLLGDIESHYGNIMKVVKCANDAQLFSNSSIARTGWHADDIFRRLNWGGISGYTVGAAVSVAAAKIRELAMSYVNEYSRSINDMIGSLGIGNSTIAPPRIPSVDTSTERKVAISSALLAITALSTIAIGIVSAYRAYQGQPSASMRKSAQEIKDGVESTYRLRESIIDMLKKGTKDACKILLNNNDIEQAQYIAFQEKMRSAESVRDIAVACNTIGIDKISFCDIPDMFETAQCLENLEVAMRSISSECSKILNQKPAFTASSPSPAPSIPAVGQLSFECHSALHHMQPDLNQILSVSMTPPHDRDVITPQHNRETPPHDRDVTKTRF